MTENPADVRTLTVRTLTGTPIPWFEEGGCIMCGFSHRFQWPSGSDASGHKGVYVACINSLVPALATLTDQLAAARAALREAKAEIQILRNTLDARDERVDYLNKLLADWQDRYYRLERASTTEECDA